MWSLTICALHTQLTANPHLEGPDTSAASSYLPGSPGPTAWEQFLYKATLTSLRIWEWKLMTTVIVDYRSRWIIFTDEYLMTTWRCSLELPKDQPISSFPSQHEHLPDPYISGQQPKVLSKACSLYCCDIKVRMKASYSLGRTYSTMIETPLSWQLARFQEAAVAQHQQENTPLKRTNTSGRCTPSRYSLYVYSWQFIEVFQDVSSPNQALS